MSVTPVELPQVVGRYRISGHLASDSIDDVYKGFDPLLERPVVVRIFRLRLADAAAESVIKRAFYGEMQRAGALTHHGIATLFDAGEWAGTLFMATEFVEAVSLAELLAGAPDLDLPLRVSLLAQMVDALEYARELGVSYLNLRPTNVLVGPDYSVKLGGFGVAAVIDAVTSATGGFIPPPSRYSAPERGRGKPGDHRSDVFSLALIALDLLGGASVRAVRGSLWQAAMVPPLPPALAAQGVNPERWAAVFDRALAADPDDRFETPGELEVELLLTLGVGAAEARAARDTKMASDSLAASRTAAPSVPAAAPLEEGATMLVSDTTRTARPMPTPDPSFSDTSSGSWPDSGTTDGTGESNRRSPAQPHNPQLFGQK